MLVETQNFTAQKHRTTGMRGQSLGFEKTGFTGSDTLKLSCRAMALVSVFSSANMG